MTEDVQTSEEKPRDAATSKSEPDTTTDGSTSVASQPSAEELLTRFTELEGKHNRLESNYKGTYSEWQRERQERERLQGLLTQYQTQTTQTTRKTDDLPDDEDLAVQEATALLNGDKTALANVRKIQRQKSTREATQETQKMFDEAGKKASQNQAVGNYLTGLGLTNTRDPVYKRVTERAQEMATDPRYSFAHGNPHWIATLAGAEVTSEMRERKAKASGAARELSVDGAVTEGSKGKSSLPGQNEADNKIYLTPSERDKGVKMLAKTYHISETDAEIRYWNALSPEMKAKRQQDKRASV